MDSDKLKFWGYSTLLTIILLVAYQFLVVNFAVVKISVETDKRSWFKIYYNEPGGVWSEEKVGRFLVVPGKLDYGLRLTNIKNISELRIDSSENEAIVAVHSIVIKQPGFQSIHIDSNKDFSQLRVGPGVKQFAHNEEGFTVVPSNKDPQLFYTLPQLQQVDMKVQRAVATLTIIAFSFFIIFVAGKVVPGFGFIPILGTVVFTLIVVMSAISEFNQHPDEMVHVRAAEYFQDHHLPPAVGDEATLHTYSAYGVSRLHSGEVAYWIAGKFCKLIEPLQLPSYLASRYFNVTLFGFMLICAYFSLHFRIILLPLLLSPQIWYIFSYFNSEGFALFVVLLAAFQMVKPDSWWNRLLEDEEDFLLAPLAILGLGVLFGLLLLLKKNFYFFLIFIGLYFLWKLLFKKTIFTRRVAFKIAGIFLVGGCLFGAVRGVDAYVNDFQKDAKLLEARELYADELFKPSTPLEKKFLFLQMKERGVSFKEVITDLRWGEKIFRTSFGEYGYTSVAGSANYYDCVRYLSLTLLLVACLSVLITGGLEGIALLAATLFCGVTLLATAFYHAWAVDFQAQGRYLLPILGMLSIGLFHLRKSIFNFPCGVLACSLYLASLYSFIFVALAGLGKLSLSIG